MIQVKPGRSLDCICGTMLKHLHTWCLFRNGVKPGTVDATQKYDTCKQNAKTVARIFNIFVLERLASKWRHLRPSSIKALQWILL